MGGAVCLVSREAGETAPTPQAIAGVAEDWPKIYTGEHPISRSVSV